FFFLLARSQRSLLRILTTGPLAGNRSRGSGGPRLRGIRMDTRGGAQDNMRRVGVAEPRGRSRFSRPPNATGTASRIVATIDSRPPCAAAIMRPALDLNPDSLSSPHPESPMAIKQLTEEQIRDWTLEQKDRWWLENVFKGDMPQL